MVKKANFSRTAKYYPPSSYLVDYLQKELRYLEPKAENESADVNIKYVREPSSQNRVAKNKTDAMHKIFQGFVDLVYFLEFIEDHAELHEVFEDTLKNLFGISNDNTSPQPGHYKNRSASLFVRFISASLFRSYGFAKGFDFRVPLANVLIFQALDAMQTRLYQNNNEMRLFANNVANTQLWSNLLASRYKDKDTISRHRIGYSIGISHVERMRQQEEERKKKEEEEKSNAAKLKRK